MRCSDYHDDTHFNVPQPALLLLLHPLEELAISRTWKSNRSLPQSQRRWCRRGLSKLLICIVRSPATVSFVPTEFAGLC